MNLFSDIFKNVGGDIFKAILGGIGGSSEAKLAIEMVKEKATLEGREQRKSLDFSAALEDFYGQQNKYRKRAALDTYGTFSLRNRYAPNMPSPPPVQVPQKPTVG